MKAPNIHPSPYPLTARATGVLIGVATFAVCLAVLWLVVTLGARLAVGLAG